MAAKLLFLANVGGISAYVLWQGIEKFYYEALGTWLLSPLIYIRLAPPPFNHWLLRLANGHPVVCWALCLIPVLLFALALYFGIRAWWTGCYRTALASTALLGGIFVVYHSVKHLGLQFLA